MHSFQSSGKRGAGGATARHPGVVAAKMRYFGVKSILKPSRSRCAPNLLKWPTAPRATKAAKHSGSNPVSTVSERCLDMSGHSGQSPKFAKVGAPPRARIKCAKVAPTPYAYRSTPGCSRGARLLGWDWPSVGVSGTVGRRVLFRQ
jgi:hypothetical protein